MIPKRSKPRRRESRIAKHGKTVHGHSSDTDNSSLSEDKIDESLKETFPASDPPSWMVITRIGSPK
jgi:hypothetical protein